MCICLWGGVTNLSIWILVNYDYENERPTAQAGAGMRAWAPRGRGRARAGAKGRKDKKGRKEAALLMLDFFFPACACARLAHSFPPLVLSRATSGRARRARYQPPQWVTV